MKVGSLNCKFDSGEGNLRLSEDFLSSDALLRADVLKDWVNELTYLYKQAIEEMRAE